MTLEQLVFGLWAGLALGLLCLFLALAGLVAWVAPTLAGIVWRRRRGR